eukprot:TRINITY_DN2619_c0_g1_i7.p1 TRINITY_DN2619_c0_g1~~TRINITY_DN2619_c0_g1_i7.p1  ORF type:complete len:4501 (-),score=1146.89 TRINITY_DN2619_c0_g1_i7:169-13671(-)
MESANKEENECFDWIESAVSALLKPKADRVKRMLSDEDSRRAVTDFLNNPETRVVVIYFVNKDDLCATQIPPPGFKRKSMYLMKHSKVVITRANIQQEVRVGDFSAKPLETLSLTLQEVHLPLLTNPLNQERWPDIVSKEVVDNLQKFVADIYVTIGQTKGKTLLPLPPAEATGDKATRDKDRVHLLEGAIVTWTKQIRNVLKMDPEAVLKSGANPGPLTEVDFWAAKAANLNSIQEQLGSEKVKKILRVLDLTKSTYYTPFSRLCKEVAKAQEEANSNSIHLEPLRKWFSRLEEAIDFISITETYQAIMHIILLIWKNSKFYNTPGRLFVLIVEICNVIIDKATQFINDKELFKMDPQDAVDRLKIALRVCGQFKSTYFDYKTIANNECPQNPWRFQNNAIFNRLDGFLERCHDVLDLMQTTVQFSKLERIEIGGSKGKSLTNSSRQIHTDFQQALQIFQNIPYDIMNVEEKKFDDDFYDYRTRIKELERRLSNIISQGFDDCTTLHSAFALIESFENISGREGIQADLERKYGDLLKMYIQDIRNVHEFFVARKDSPPTSANLPPTAGSIIWVRGLMERSEGPMAKFKELDRSLFENEEGKEAAKTLQICMADYKEFEQQMYEAWASEVESTSQSKLKQPLLRRDPATRYLIVNVDPDLLRLIREVKYLSQLGFSIPEGSMAVFKKAEVFRTTAGNLDLIVNRYNGILGSLFDIERPLFQQKIDEIDSSLEKGLQHLNWKSHGIQEFITSGMSKVKETAVVLASFKTSLRSIEKILSGWTTTMLFERKAGKTYTPEDFMENIYKPLLATRRCEIDDGGKDIHTLLQESNKILKMSKGAPAWRSYLEWVNHIVIQHFQQTVFHNLVYLKDQIAPRQGGERVAELCPLLEIKAELVAPEILFNPDLGEVGQLGIRNLVQGWIYDFCSVAGTMKRLDNNDSDYVYDIRNCEQIIQLIQEIHDAVVANEDECRQYRDSFMAFSHLWANDPSKGFARFLEEESVEIPEARPKTESKRAPSSQQLPYYEDPFEREIVQMLHAKSIRVRREPPLAKFDEWIGKYKSIQDSISQLPNATSVGWLRIDARPLKQALSTWATKWIFVFTHHLVGDVVESLRSIHDFIAKTDAGLDRSPAPGDIDTLMKVLGHLRDVRTKGDQIDTDFDPIRAKVSLLKKYGIPLPEQTLESLEECPGRWFNLKRKANVARDRVSSLQHSEIDRIRARGSTFEAKLNDFLEKFKSLAPFNYDFGATAAYARIDEYMKLMQAVEKEAADMNYLRELFEIPSSAYPQLVEAKKNLVLLKHCWDMVSIASVELTEWKSTSWQDMDTEKLIERAHRLSEDIRFLPEIARSWDVYIGMENEIKNTIVALPVVHQLHSHSMRERHWKQVMRATGVHFTITSTVNLGELLGLRLHNYVDEIASIVDRANKEQIMEKNLLMIEDAWEKMEVRYAAMKGTYSIVVPQALLITLEEHLVTLQNIRANKYVAHFQDEVNKWQKKLATVEAVLNVWTSVQQLWSNLESLYHESDDIRTQLADDWKRFSQADSEWRELMREAHTITNTIETCNRDGRLETLERLSSSLERCQRALTEYLKTKRASFPRFYFVSDGDVIDMISKGSIPKEIQQHIPKIFTHVQQLELDGDDFTTNIRGLLSREGERLSFSNVFVCEGGIEHWMAQLHHQISRTLRGRLSDALGNLPKNSSDWISWIAAYPAQIVLTACLVRWTAYVSAALSSVEEAGDHALKQVHEEIEQTISDLGDALRGSLSHQDRLKFMAVLTSQIHFRDTVNDLIRQKVSSANSYEWKSKLKARWITDSSSGSDVEECVIELSDYSQNYMFEYLGNSGKLVMTPLTDRCFHTLTQALQLHLGAACMGPSGTGKTESIKDLGKVLGLPVFVFNCSHQMDHVTLGKVFLGLAQTGLWGCLDEFNRLTPEVLSVAAMQIKAIFDALHTRDISHPRTHPAVMKHNGQDVSILPSVGIFVTMKFDQSDRVIPENIKSLFRPVAMAQPDIQIICEVMLSTEGFSHARPLAPKVVHLFRIASELLSKQNHYDWGLRSIKPRLRAAGVARRNETDVDEETILMRTLERLTIPSLVADDIQPFQQILNDLFTPSAPNSALLRNEIEACAKTIAISAGLQPEVAFLGKVRQLYDSFQVRQSVFVIGPPACGKSEIWKTLALAQNVLGTKTEWSVVDPKSLSTAELYGFFHPTTKAWQDGVLVQLIRAAVAPDVEGKRWIVLDGDVDPVWIESLNTVMDDNKVLTLASGERIVVNPSLQLVIETSDISKATPATVSRAAILYVDEKDLGWRPYVQTWLSRNSSPMDSKILITLFEKYLPPLIRHQQSNLQVLLPVSTMGIIHSLCAMLEGLIAKENLRDKTSAEAWEHYFAYVCMWAFGGFLSSDAHEDHRARFNIYFRGQFSLPFPEGGSIFDYYVDSQSHAFTNWSEQVPTFIPSSDALVVGSLIPTPETVRLSYMSDVVNIAGRPALYVGGAGTGKSIFVRDRLRHYGEDTRSLVINLDASTSSAFLQGLIEQNLEKKTGKIFAPNAASRLVIVLDDVNMPSSDEFGTQPTTSLLRQHLSYGLWYDREQMGIHEVRGVEYLATMNPYQGHRKVDPRFLRHFALFGVPFPSTDCIKQIYGSILSNHLVSFDPSISKMSDRIVAATIELQLDKIRPVFFPTANKFHYNFSMRDMTNVILGLQLSRPEVYNTPESIIKLWFHECSRVYCDRLLSDSDVVLMTGIVVDAYKKYFFEYTQADLQNEPLIYACISQSSSEDDVTYSPVASYSKLLKILKEKLAEYNESHTPLDLVLFESAMNHLCRINRILQIPRGNGLLVGTTGTGKTSLIKLASFMSGCETFHVSPSPFYDSTAFRNDLMQLYHRVGVRNTKTLFFISDYEITDPYMLVAISNLMSSGYVPDLFSKEDREQINAAVRPEVKQSGHLDTPENCWNYFIEKVRRNLHVIMSFSPDSPFFRTSCEQFPSLLQYATLDWFHPWPRDALVSVATRSLSDLDLDNEDLQENIAYHLAYMHGVVEEESLRYLEQDRRHNHVTPKNFLECVNTYKAIVQEKRSYLSSMQVRLENGLKRLKRTQEDIWELKNHLQQEQLVVEEKKASTEQLLIQVGQEKNIAEEQKAVAAAEELKAADAAREADSIRSECDSDLKAAEPAMTAAERALEVLDKASLTELKSFSKPPKEVVDTLAAIMVMTSPAAKIPKDLSWNAIKKFIGSPDKFFTILKNFDKESLSEAHMVHVRTYLDNPSNTFELIASKSKTCANLFDWVRNMAAFYAVYVVIQPKRDRLREAMERKAAADQKVDAVRAKVADLQSRVQKLTEALERSTEEKNRVMLQAEKTQLRLHTAERLVSGLTNEQVRWGIQMNRFKERQTLLLGDALLAAGFLTYAGCFSLSFRLQIIAEKWVPDLRSRDIPLSQDIDPLLIMSDDAEIAGWLSEQLPPDRFSVENAFIILRSRRWPLIIDPHAQVTTWIKRHEAQNHLCVARPVQPDFASVVEAAVTSGEPLLVEHLDVALPSCLSGLVNMQITKKGRSHYVMIGDKEVEYNPKFRLFLQTNIPNPVFNPDYYAKLTVVNANITTQGLAEQLLNVVVLAEAPELEKERDQIIYSQNTNKIKLKELEDSILNRLSDSAGDILADSSLIEYLESTKQLTTSIIEEASQQMQTTAKLNETRALYSSIAERGAVLYSVADELSHLNHLYRYSLESFVDVLKHVLVSTPRSEDVEKRVESLKVNLTLELYHFLAQGLYEKDQIVLLCAIALRTSAVSEESEAQALRMFIYGSPSSPSSAAPLSDNPCKSWLNDSAWTAIESLRLVSSLASLCDDVADHPNKWQTWFQQPIVEAADLPLGFETLGPMSRLCVIKALRPDRLQEAVHLFISAHPSMGPRFLTPQQDKDLASLLATTANTAPILFLLSMGVDPLADIEACARTKEMKPGSERFVYLSMGDGQETAASEAVLGAQKEGRWVVLHNIHLAGKWLVQLESLVEASTDLHADYRLFLTCEAAVTVPVPLLQRCVKIVSQPLQGLRANILHNYAQLDEDAYQNCAKATEYRAIASAMCAFHALAIERRKFGQLGWNFKYHFGTSDLLSCLNILRRYLDGAKGAMPWNHLRYIFSDIIYGGHIPDAWDRRVLRTYLDKFLQENLLEDVELFPGYNSMPALGLQEARERIEGIESLKAPDAPHLFGIHPNADLQYRMDLAEFLATNLKQLYPAEVVSYSGITREDQVKMVIDDISERLPELFDVASLRERVDDQVPMQEVFLQEAVQMNVLLREIRVSLNEIDMTLKGEITLQASVGRMMDSLAKDQVPESWERVAYPSLRKLGSWFENLLKRYQQIKAWSRYLVLPKVTWISGLFNPQAFMIAIKQAAARQTKIPLEKLIITTEVIRKNPEEIDSAAKTGAYIHGLWIEGCQWDDQNAILNESIGGMLYDLLTVIHVKAVNVDDFDARGTYECPIYSTQQRGATYQFTAHLKSVSPSSKWILAGVAMLMDVVKYT